MSTETNTFGPYRLDELLGRGGMGEVHRAFDTRRNREVAVTDADELVLTARTVQGTCTSAPVGYGVAVDAAVTR